MRNIEIKAYARNLQAVIENVKSFSNSEGRIIQQHDTFFKVRQGRLKLRKFEVNITFSNILNKKFVY